MGFLAQELGNGVPPVPRRLSIVIPVYGSEAILPELARRLESVLVAIADDFELILVNDCSPDGSWDVICDLVQRHRWIRAVNLMQIGRAHV